MGASDGVVEKGLQIYMNDKNAQSRAENLITLLVSIIMRRI